MNALLNHVWGRSRAQDRIWKQVTGLSPNTDARRLLMALNLQAFIDDSVGPAREFILAGHIAPAEAWALFAKEWEALLPSATVAKNGKRHFKMKEMASNPERLSRVPAFYWIIEKYVLVSISCRLNLDDFEEALRRVESDYAFMFKASVHFGYLKNPYRYLFQAFLDGFHSRRLESQYQSKIPLTEKVDFIFDNQSEKPRFSMAGVIISNLATRMCVISMGQRHVSRMTRSFCRSKLRISGRGGCASGTRKMLPICPIK